MWLPDSLIRGTMGTRATRISELAMTAEDAAIQLASLIDMRNPFIQVLWADREFQQICDNLSFTCFILDVVGEKHVPIIQGSAK